jgi:hypothetical protein
MTTWRQPVARSRTSGTCKPSEGRGTGEPDARERKRLSDSRKEHFDVSSAGMNSRWPRRDGSRCLPAIRRTDVAGAGMKQP